MAVQTLMHAGRELRYCAPLKGQTDRPPVLCIHGAFAGAWMWDDTLMSLAEQGYPALAVSLRGHGASEGQEELDWLSIDDYVADVAVAAEWLGAEPIVIGHSMGGFVAQKFLERHRAKGLVLLCSVPPQGLLATQFYLMFRRPGLFIQLNQILEGKIPNASLVRDALFAGEVADEVVDAFLSRTQRESTRAIWDMSLFNLMGLGVRELPPVLVMGAGEDALIPAFAVQATARTYGVAAHIFPDMGHAVTHELGWPAMRAVLLDWASELR